MSERSEAIVCNGLRKSYGDRVAVPGLALRVEAGTVVGFLGPNGAGKTTAIRLLTTILPPDAGTFEVAGVPGSDPAGIRARIGVLPESAGYPANRTGAELLALHGQLYGLTRRQALDTATGLLGQVGLGDRAGSLIGGYSRGMRQRLGIARALVNSPTVIFLDEPTLGLDPAGQRQVLALIATVARERGTTVLLSTHQLAEVEDVCDRVVVLNRGRVVADGSVYAVAQTAAAPREGRVRVPPSLRQTAADALIGLLEIGHAAVTDAHDEVAFTLGDGVSAVDGGRAVLGALDAAGIPVLSFELERARLADAFLAITAEPLEAVAV